MRANFFPNSPGSNKNDPLETRVFANGLLINEDELILVNTLDKRAENEEEKSASHQPSSH